MYERIYTAYTRVVEGVSSHNPFPSVSIPRRGIRTSPEHNFSRYLFSSVPISFFFLRISPHVRHLRIFNEADLQYARKGKTLTLGYAPLSRNSFSRASTKDFHFAPPSAGIFSSKSVDIINKSRLVRSPTPRPPAPPQIPAAKSYFLRITLSHRSSFYELSKSRRGDDRRRAKEKRTNARSDERIDEKNSRIKENERY